MLGGGAIAAMMQSLRSNRNLIKERHNKHQAFEKNGKLLHKKLQYKQVSPRQTELFIQKIKARKKKEKQIRVVIWVIAIVLVAITIYFISI
ncbi:hypothetical protein ACUNWD_07780 [Sunxiuqinia sp. A32]|uniref:hypothetical protein n=1 Tax=Sunxiuqinia sp. A32 TaxID=3461496 RepID=UPI00404635A8